MKRKPLGRRKPPYEDQVSLNLLKPLLKEVQEDLAFSERLSRFKCSTA